MNKIIENVLSVVENIENTSKSLDGSVKKESAVKTLNRLYLELDNKYKYPKFIDNAVQEFITPLLVDLAVMIMNKYVWKKV